MAQVTLYFNRRRLGEVELKTAKARVGRHPAADVFLPHQSVSRLHALLVREGRSWELHDPGGTNGLFVNGARVKDTRVLANGDRIQVAQYTLIFDTGEMDAMAIVASLNSAGRAKETRPEPSFVPKPEGTERFDKTMELNMMQTHVQQHRARVRERAHLNWTSSNGERAMVELGDQPITIGSADYCRITLPRRWGTGRLHAVLAPNRGEYDIERAAFWNVIRVNGKRTPKTQRLHDGDRIAIGPEVLQFFGALFRE